MQKKNSVFNLWKVTDGLNNPIVYSADQKIAEIHYCRRDRKNEAAKLYCCIEKKGLADEDQEWLIHDENCDSKSGKFIERTTID
jgi:hypothetical protein